MRASVRFGPRHLRMPTTNRGWKAGIPEECYRGELIKRRSARGNCKVGQVFSLPEDASLNMQTEVTPRQRATSTRPQKQMDVAAGTACRSRSAGHTNVEIEGNEMVVTLAGSPRRRSFAAQLRHLLLELTFIHREVDVGLDQLVGGQLAWDRMERPDLGYRPYRSTIEIAAAGMPRHDHIFSSASI